MHGKKSKVSYFSEDQNFLLAKLHCSRRCSADYNSVCMGYSRLVGSILRRITRSRRMIGMKCISLATMARVATSGSAAITERFDSWENSRFVVVKERGFVGTV